jgi:ABC-type branched-subunit amino acid transport system substrate-binding protein
MEFVEGAKRLGHPIAIEQRFMPGTTEFGTLIEKIKEVDPDALVLWGDPKETGSALRQARAAGLNVPAFGYDRMHQDLFLKEAGAAAEGTVLVASLDLDSQEPDWLRFVREYTARWGEKPDSFAAHAYDGMNLILQAIRRAGLNKPRIRDALFEIGTWRGVTGPIVFDTNMSDIGPLWLATVRGGRFTHAPAPPWTSDSDSAQDTRAREAQDGAGGRASR